MKNELNLNWVFVGKKNEFLYKKKWFVVNVIVDELTVPENLNSMIKLLFLACQGDVKGVEELLKEGTDVNSIDLDGRTALHIAACDGHVDVVKMLLSRKANIDACDRWGSMVSFRHASYCICGIFIL